MTLGEKLKLIRENNNLNQEDFAEQFHVSRQTISKWELDKTYPELKRLIEISKHYSVSIEYLLNNEAEYSLSKEEKYSLHEFEILYQKYSRLRMKRLYVLLLKIIIALFVFEGLQIVVNMVRFSRLSPYNSTLWAFQWDSYGSLLGITPHYFFIPLLAIIAIFFTNIFQNTTDREIFLNQFGYQLEQSAETPKSNKKKIYILVFMLNMIYMMKLFVMYLGFLTFTSIFDAFANSYIGIGVTSFPNKSALLLQMNSIDMRIIAIFLLVSGCIVFYIVNESYQKNIQKFMIPVCSLVLYGISFMINDYLTLLFLNWIILTTLLTITLKRYYSGKPLKNLLILYFIVFTIISGISIAIQWYSFKSLILFEAPLAIFVNDLDDITSLQSFATAAWTVVILEFSFGVEFILIGGALVLSVVNFIAKIRKSDYRISYRKSSFYWFSSSVIVYTVLLIATAVYMTVNYLSYLGITQDQFDSEINLSIEPNRCYSDRFLQMGVGQDLVDENMVYIRCFDTTKGEYRVYYELESISKDNIFDLYYENVVYSRVYVINQDNEIVLNRDYEGYNLTVFVTDIESAEAGSFEMISITYNDQLNQNANYQDDDLFDYVYEFYSIDGDFIVTIYHPFFHSLSIRTDNMTRTYDVIAKEYLSNNQSIYYLLGVQEGEFSIWQYDFIENTTTQIDDDTWEQLSDIYDDRD